jgi:hypothetical protein
LWRSRISGAPLRKSFALHRIRDTHLLRRVWRGQFEVKIMQVWALREIAG